MNPGTRLGSYEILSLLGAGGMGEVYRARDIKLNRDVALKVLPLAFADDPARMARFEREARMLAALNHANIATIYGMEETESTRALAMEVVEGPTLADRIRQRAIPLEEALTIAKQIADALEYAHEKGILHRDLKPANIKVTPEGKVKVLDFGLAKAMQEDRTGSPDLPNSPTLSMGATQAGVILGTAAYMAPEQARGKAIDQRTDIWAFGCVLFECLTGKQAFAAETVSDTLAAILKEEPDWASLPSDLPWNVKQMLHRCLQKDSRQRLHDIADARIEIDAPAATDALPPAAAFGSRRFPVIWLVACGALLLGAGLLAGLSLPRYFHPAVPAQLVSSTLKIEPGYCLSGRPVPGEGQDGRPSRPAIAISSDGTFIVYSAREEKGLLQGKSQLYLRRLDQAVAKAIPGTEGGIYPFLSPDNRWVGFWSEGNDYYSPNANDYHSPNAKLKKIPIAGGVSVTLGEATELSGASWGRDNSIVYSDMILSEGRDMGLLRISSDGGKPVVLTKPDPKREEYNHRLPAWLPKGNALLFTIIRHDMDAQPRVALLRLSTGAWQDLIENAADARYIPTGHIVFLRQGTLMAVRFDLTGQKIVGQPFPLVENVMQALVGSTHNFNTGAGQFAVADNGTLVYAVGGVPPDPKRSLVWIDRQGSEQQISEFQLPFSRPRLSPDGQKIAYIKQGLVRQVWVYDIGRGTNRQVTAEGRSYGLVWTPDGKRLVFGWCKSGMINLFWQPYDGSAPLERLTTSHSDQGATSFSPDGMKLALDESNPETGADTLILDLPSGTVTPLVHSKSDEEGAQFSADGRWIAYMSNETKREEIYVRPFPGPGPIVQVSTEGGTSALWSRDGKQLFYRYRHQFWAVDIRTAGGFYAGKPRLLFQKHGISGWWLEDLSPDGQRFLMVKAPTVKEPSVTELVLVQNWFQELQHLAPAAGR